MQYLYWSIWGVSLIAMLVYYRKRKHPILTATVSMVVGVSSLIACHYLGYSFGFSPPINIFNTMLSLTLGLPSIVLMYISTLI
jgi:hypothetical protein